MHITQPKLPPFSSHFSPGLPALLRKLHCAVAISAFQTGKLIVLSAEDDETLVQLPRSFNKPMGLALHGHKMAVACMDEVLVLSNAPGLAVDYPSRPHYYDTLFLPRCTYHTGALDIHDLGWAADGGLLAVNTSFSCITRIDDAHSFTPVWKPPFVSRLAKEYRCHLNGMALDGGKPRFATALGRSDDAEGWRSSLADGGVLMDVDTGELIAAHLPMPHSPRCKDGALYMLLSATGEFVKMDLATGKYEVIVRLDSFVRGLCLYGDYAFIGMSRWRNERNAPVVLPLSGKPLQAGLAVVHLASGRVEGAVHYHSALEEVYEVQVIPGCLRPGILNTLKPLHKLGITAPGMALWEKQESRGEEEQQALQQKQRLMRDN